VLKRAGLEGRDTVFLFADTQIVQESMLEDVNNLLNAGEVRTGWDGWDGWDGGDCDGSTLLL
jgi:dynein heavy chain